MTESTRAFARASALVLALVVLAPAPAVRADPLSDVESLVRTTYYEGLPYDVAGRLTGAQIARLAEMLADPGESVHHGNVVMALGMSGDPAAFAPLTAFAAAPLAGEVDRAAYRARTRVPLALGHLARSDSRALDWLIAEAARPEAVPAWSFRHLHGAALATVLREQILSGLGISGAPEADAALARATADPDRRRRRHAQNARELHDRVARHGASAVFEGARP